MNGNNDWQDAAVAGMEERPETPPPPYNLEDSNPFSTSNLHDPELAELEAGIPYQVRGSIPSFAVGVVAKWEAIN